MPGSSEVTWLSCEMSASGSRITGSTAFDACLVKWQRKSTSVVRRTALSRSRSSVQPQHL
eukprot:4715705-Prymnesium_polylepis.2